MRARDRALVALARIPGLQLTYSQRGEDLLIDTALRSMGVSVPNYVDIGAHHATYLSNTALFYSRGATGVVVEADPDLATQLQAKRPRDKCVNAGVSGSVAGTAPFYVMSIPTLNTFSEEGAQELERSEGLRIERVLSIPLIPVNELLSAHVQGELDLLSLDTEGSDLEILTALDLERFRPKAICVETLGYSSDHREQKKLLEFHQLLLAKDYFAYADTFINTIFVDARAWARSGQPKPNTCLITGTTA